MTMVGHFKMSDTIQDIIKGKPLFLLAVPHPAFVSYTPRFC